MSAEQQQQQQAVKPATTTSAEARKRMRDATAERKGLVCEALDAEARALLVSASASASATTTTTATWPGAREGAAFFSLSLCDTYTENGLQKKGMLVFAGVWGKCRGKRAFPGMDQLRGWAREELGRARDKVCR